MYLLKLGVVAVACVVAVVGLVAVAATGDIVGVVVAAEVLVAHIVDVVAVK